MAERADRRSSADMAWSWEHVPQAPVGVEMVLSVEQGPKTKFRYVCIVDVPISTTIGPLQI